MGNEAKWDTFTHTGKVTDYLAYARSDSRSENYTSWEKDGKEERGQRERTSDGHSAFGSYHW